MKPRRRRAAFDVLISNPRTPVEGAVARRHDPPIVSLE
jgi:hypothetical protein